ncbi:LysM peptidoglycan-binding domain-containing protein [Clostridium sp.]|uniref:LysM peptidoglycan-binding domain-containing protein n=1 Tax=Clostridium sp. TaxID=1506 RepID=UPI00261F00AD|nr:LysM peptidoglycan-binding domain-containing protein [Clostridium sp.]
MNKKDVAILSGSLVCVALLGYFTYSTVSTVLKSKATSQKVISQDQNKNEDTTEESNDKNSNKQESLNSRLEDASNSSNEKDSKECNTKDNSSQNSKEDEKESSKEKTNDKNSQKITTEKESSNDNEKNIKSKEESKESQSKDKKIENSKENEEENSSSKKDSSNKNLTSSSKKEVPTFSTYLKDIETEKYTLKEDESLNDVAKKFKGTCAVNSSLNILKSLNQVNNVSALKTGDTILVPVKALKEGTNYKVKEGDTWYNLARKHYPKYNHEVVIEFLMDVNPFSKEILPLGEEIFLPKI